MPLHHILTGPALHQLSPSLGGLRQLLQRHEEGGTKVHLSETTRGVGG